MTTREPYRAQRIGNLRERVTLQSFTEGYNEDNEPVSEWVDVATVHARVEPLKADERIIAGGVTATFDVLVHIRHRAGIDPTWRIKHGDRYLGIISSRNLDERGRYLTLECAGIAATSPSSVQA